MNHKVWTKPRTVKDLRTYLERRRLVDPEEAVMYSVLFEGAGFLVGVSDDTFVMNLPTKDGRDDWTPDSPSIEKEMIAAGTVDIDWENCPWSLSNKQRLN